MSKPSLFSNAVQSIQIGIEDYSKNDPRRALSALFLAVMALVLSALRVLAVVVLAELFVWRSPLVYALPGALIGVVVWWNLSPRILDSVDPIAACEIALVAVAGTIYWAVAGRRAGSWRGA